MQARVFLAASLQGSAVKVLGNLTRGGSHITYQELVSLLEKRFGPRRLAENHLMELRHRRQGPRESLQELGQSVRELTALAYPELTKEGRDRLARGHFSDAVEEQAIREGIFRARPKSLDDAVRAALNTEGFNKIEEHRGSRRSKLARTVESEGSYPLTEVMEEQRQFKKSFLENQREVKAWMEKITQTITPRTTANGQTTGGIYRRWKGTPNESCYRCKEKGHFARNCRQLPFRKETSSGNDNQPTQRPAGKLDGTQGR